MANPSPMTITVRTSTLLESRVIARSLAPFTMNPARTISCLAQALVDALSQRRSCLFAEAGVQGRVVAVLAVQVRRLQPAADETLGDVPGRTLPGFIGGLRNALHHHVCTSALMSATLP